MVAKYREGDVLKESDFDESGNLYIVIDIADFTSNNDEAVSDDYLIEYGVYQIYPIAFTSKYFTFRQDRVELHVQDGTTPAKLLHEHIKRERSIRGWNDVPDFVKTLHTGMKSRDVYLRKEYTPLVQVNTVNARSWIEGKIDDIASREEEKRKESLLKTVDDCLDAINYANFLYALLGDEKYIDFKNKALARLEQLTC